MSGGLAHQPSGLSSERTRVSVLGGGAWGTALALHAARMGHEVCVPLGLGVGWGSTRPPG